MLAFAFLSYRVDTSFHDDEDKAKENGYPSVRLLTVRSPNGPLPLPWRTPTHESEKQSSESRSVHWGIGIVLSFSRSLEKKTHTTATAPRRSIRCFKFKPWPPLLSPLSNLNLPPPFAADVYRRRILDS